MTPKKNHGRKPDVTECIAGWAAWNRNQETCQDDWACYCGRIVEKALGELERRSYDILVMRALLAHVHVRGSVAGFRVNRIVAVPPANWPVGSEEDTAAKVHSLARLAWYALRSVVEQQLRTSIAFTGRLGGGPS